MFYQDEGCFSSALWHEGRGLLVRLSECDDGIFLGMNTGSRNPSLLNGFYYEDVRRDFTHFCLLQHRRNRRSCAVGMQASGSFACANSQGLEPHPPHNNRICGKTKANEAHR